MKKRGFTLVELLAVIAILAILVIMALPAVLRMYRQSRINNFQNEVRSTYRTAQSQFLGDSMLLGSGQKILYTNGCNSSSDADIVKSLDMTGNSNFKYYVLIDVDGKVLEVRSTNGTYNDSTLDSDISSTICTASGERGSGSSTPSATNVATCVTEGCTKTAVGTELTVGGENFYVVSSDATNTVLLAKYDLKEDGSGSYTQDTSGTKTDVIKVRFLDSNGVAYWDEAQCVYNSIWSCPGTSGLLSPYNNSSNAVGTIEYVETYPYVYDSNAIYIEPIVTSYANKIGTAAGITVTGKLMTYEQANSLSTNVRKDFNSTYYWLGSAYNYGSVWYVDVSSSINGNAAYGTRGVRPVIIVPTSSL